MSAIIKTLSAVALILCTTVTGHADVDCRRPEMSDAEAKEEFNSCPNARGTITFDGYLRPVVRHIPSKGLVFTGLNITDVEFYSVDVSHLTGLGEAIWRRVANKFIDVIEIDS